MLTIQEENPSDDRESCRVRTVWRRWLSLWLKRKYNCKTFTKQSLTKESTKKPVGGFWRWLTLKRLLLRTNSRRPPHHLETSDQLHSNRQSALEPGFMSSPLVLRNRCFLEEGEPIKSDRMAGRFFLEARLKTLGLHASDISGRVRDGQNNRIGDDEEPAGACNIFRAFRRHTAPELRFHFGEESDSDLEELLVEDDEEDDDGDGEGEGADTESD